MNEFQLPGIYDSKVAFKSSVFLQIKNHKQNYSKLFINNTINTNQSVINITPLDITGENLHVHFFSSFQKCISYMIWFMVLLLYLQSYQCSILLHHHIFSAYVIKYSMPPSYKNTVTMLHMILTYHSIIYLHILLYIIN